MNRTSWHDRIVIDPELHHGNPCVKGTRIPISIILGSLADGRIRTSELTRRRETEDGRRKRRAREPVAAHVLRLTSLVSRLTSEEIADRTITISGYSKTYSITGWRIWGVALDP